MNIVTGYKGFIGSHLMNRVKDPVGFDIVNCFDLIDSFEEWKDADCIYHMGAISDTTETDFDKIYTFNIYYTIKLFEKCIEYGVPIKYASSASIYGNSEIPLQLNPLNLYAMSKATIDLWAGDNLEKFKHIQGFRFFNVYGNGEDHKGNQASPIHKFRKEVEEKGTISIFEGSREFWRDFVCVEDVCHIMLNNELPSGIYDLGSGITCSFQTVAKIIKDKYGGEIKTIPFPDHLRGKYQIHTFSNNPKYKYKFKDLFTWIQEQT